MAELDDSIATAEQRVAGSKAVMQAEFRAIEAKALRAASSPMLLGGALLIALSIGYLAIGARGRPNIAGSRPSRGTWSQLLEIGKLLMPLLGTVVAAQNAKAKRRTISPAGGTSEELPGSVGSHDEL